MVLKVKNSRSLILIVLVISAVFVFIFINSYSAKSQTHTNNFGENYEAKVRDSLMRLSYNLKSSLGQVETSSEVCVVGIDDATIEAYGKLGGPLWNLRVPYNAFLKYTQKYFTPSCISMDLIFKTDSGSLIEEIGESKVSENPEVILKLSNTLKTYSDTFEGLTPDTLLKLSTLLAEQGETSIGTTFALLQEPFGLDLPKVPVITAISLTENERDYLAKIDFNDKAFYQWKVKEVVGDDPSFQDESMGKSIPYLRKISIPVDNVSNVPDDYVYMPHGNLISSNFIDFVSLGFVNVRRDADGIVRKVPMVLATKFYNPKEKKLKTLFIPSMSLMSCIKHWKAEYKDIKVKFGDKIEIKTSKGVKNIPIDKYGRLLADFNFRPKDMNYVSFSKINEFGAGLSKQGEKSFKGEFKKSLDQVKSSLRNNIVLVGLNYTANPDTGPTAIDTNLSFVYVHAAAINSLLKGEYLVPASDFKIYLSIAGICIFLATGSLLMSLNGFSIIFFLSELIIGLSSFAGIYFSSFYIPTLFLAGYSFSIFLVVVLFRYFSEEKEKLKIRNMFSTMVSSSVLDYMETNPESFSLSGSKMAATIMFSDVAGFTTISEGLTPEKLVQLLNKYLTPMTDIIQDSGGYVDKYEGDAIMAEWGVPFANDQHAALACFACLDQQKKLDEIREQLFKEFGYRLTVRMGVNSGEVSAGNMGSVNRFSYTVMGDAVNLAARLEPTNKVYGTYIMIGENTYDLAKDSIEARLVDKVVVVGKKQAIRVYELLARKGELAAEKKKMLEHYEKGLELHEKRLWDEAISEFNKALEAVPDDQASKVLIERVEEYKTNPPGDDWQGEYVRTSKD